MFETTAAFVPEAFARDWVAAWNRSDLEWILGHHADRVTFVSSVAAAVTGNAEVHGKAALRAYWTAALGSLSFPLRFSLDSYVWDDRNRVLLVVYLSTEPNRIVRKCEWMRFGPDGLIDRGEGFSGATVGSNPSK